MATSAVLLLIAGPPCSGKSTLAQRLQEHLVWPLLMKDVIKDLTFTHLGAQDRSWSRRVSDLAWDLMFETAGQIARSGGSAILEGNFRPQHTARLLALTSQAPVRFLQVHCQAQGEQLWSRFKARARDGTRHPGHVDAAVVAELRTELLAGSHPDLALPGPILRHDTSVPNARSVEQLIAELDLALGAK